MNFDCNLPRCLSEGVRNIDIASYTHDHSEIYTFTCYIRIYVLLLHLTSHQQLRSYGDVATAYSHIQ